MDQKSSISADDIEGWLETLWQMKIHPTSLQVMKSC
jgi:hypothetical protein